jgi:hypothetical protein
LGSEEIHVGQNIVFSFLGLDQILRLTKEGLTDHICLNIEISKVFQNSVGAFAIIRIQRLESEYKQTITSKSDNAEKGNATTSAEASTWRLTVIEEYSLVRFIPDAICPRCINIVPALSIVDNILGACASAALVENTELNMLR